MLNIVLWRGELRPPSNPLLPVTPTEHAAWQAMTQTWTASSRPVLEGMQRLR